MNAALQNTGRSAVKERLEELGNGSRRPVTEKVTVANCDRRTDEQRAADLAAEATKRRVSRMCFV